MTKPLKHKLTYPLAGFLIFMVIVISGFFYFDRLLNKPVKIKDLKIDTKAALKLNVLQQISKKNGIKEWELKAESATLLKNENKAVLVDVAIIFYTKETKKIHLKAEKGLLNTKSHDMIFSDNVVVSYEDATLKTDKLHYNKKKHIIYSNTNVKFTKKGSIIKADSMITKVNERQTILKGHVQGRFSEDFNTL